MAKLREEVIGWLYTISGINERSFPLGIKNVNMKELLVIFPLLLLAINFAFRNITLALAFIIPVIFIVLYEEKSMDEFQYVYHFVKFYVLDLLTPKEKVKPVKQHKKITIKIDDVVLTVSTLLALINAPAFIQTLELKFNYPATLIQLLMFATGTGIAIGLTIVKIALAMRKKKSSS